MAEKSYHPGENYRYPLIIKKLLATPLMDSPDRQIVYSDRHRYTYKDFEKRIAMLANDLATLGLRPGETVKTYVVIADNGPPDMKRGFAAEYEALLESAGSGSLRSTWKM